MSTGEATKETSVIFSLQELMRMEQDRITDQERERQQQLREREKAEREAKRLAAAAQEEKLRQEEQQRRAEDARAREEVARIEAMQRAILEAERARAIEQARKAQSEHELIHSLELERTVLALSRNRLRAVLMGVSIAACLLIGVISTASFGLMLPQSERRVASLQERSARFEQENEGLKRRLETSSAKTDRLVEQLQTSETARGTLTARLDEAERELERLGRKPSPTAGPSGTPKPPPGPACSNPLDPMCQNGQVLR